MRPSDVFSGAARWAAVRADALDALRAFPDDSAHAFVLDPPAGIAFMGKEWDHSKGGRAEWIAWLAAIMREALRVLRPGGHSLVWAIPRTSHWTATAVEDAGFEIRDRIHDLAAADLSLVNFLDALNANQRDALWRIIDGQASPLLLHLFGQGFPKSANVAKLIDKAAGVKPLREEAPSLGMATGPNADQWNDLKRRLIMPPPTTDKAKEWAGWGTALKPAAEHWVLARKPFDGSVNRNVVRHGTGAINIGGCRIAHAEECRVMPDQYGDKARNFFRQGGRHGETLELKPEGRWPAHLVLAHAPGCVVVGEETLRNDAGEQKAGGEVFSGHPDRAQYGYERSEWGGRAFETIPVFACAVGCPVGALDAQTRNDAGGASRFFYTAKAAVSEKDAGCENLRVVTPEEMTGRKAGSAGLVMEHTDGSAKANPYAGTSGANPRRNHHPTVKPVSLMRWLCRLVCPKDGVIVDPFMGSGTTGVAALAEGFRFVGVERDDDGNGKPLGYFEIALARLRHAAGLPPSGAELPPSGASGGVPSAADLALSFDDIPAVVLAVIPSAAEAALDL